jgi:hypothetical protein
MHKEPVDLTMVTVEHILPQTLTPEWEIELDVNPKDAQEVHQRLLHTIGNLTLTAYNSELGNISFSEKKLKLANTHIELNRLILEREKWRGLEIVMRAGELLKLANKIWAGPATSS